jgi:hypothetical protein
MPPGGTGAAGQLALRRPFRDSWPACVRRCGPPARGKSGPGGGRSGRLVVRPSDRRALARPVPMPRPGTGKPGAWRRPATLSETESRAPGGARLLSASTFPLSGPVPTPGQQRRLAAPLLHSVRARVLPFGLDVLALEWVECYFCWDVVSLPFC